MLTLPIKKKWFDMIRFGEKTQEYRDIKPYYTKRFMNVFAPYYDGEPIWERQFKEECRADWFLGEPKQIRFRNGYSANSPSFIAECDLRIGTGNELWGAEFGRDYYILEIRNITKKRHC